ncbi:MAG: hypothetical protein NVS2B14_07040 [Chamaesiphon sp.]
MLVCPQCQSENPDSNKFCEKCGTSLTHKNCPQCDAEVPLSEEHCQNCGASTGKVWWAIVSKDLDLQRSLSEQQTPTVDTAASEVAALPQTDASLDVSAEASAPLMVEKSAADENISVSTTELESSDEADTQPLSIPAAESGISQEVLPTVVYLDAQQRYKVLESPIPNQKTPNTVAMRVLDCQPLQKSLVETLMDRQLDLPQGSLGSDSTSLMGIPAIAQPYLTLPPELYPTLPKIHDAWQQDEQSVMLLEDRSEWLLLGDLWKDDQIPTLQILRWLDDMASLWAALEPWHWRQSLLELTNLRVDEDQTLSLQQLYQEPENDDHLTLQDLGTIWQTLFHQSQRTQFLSLTQLLRNIESGEIETIAQLRDRLLEIANELQPSTGAMEAKSTDVKTGEPTVKSQESEFTIDDSEENFLPFTFENLAGESTEGDDMPTVVLPKFLSRLDDAGGTHTGRQRNHNEDFFAIQTKIDKQENPRGRTIEAHGLYILCDGMGGHAGGEVASAMAVETLKRYFEDNWNEQLSTEDSMREAVRLANQAIYDVNQNNARSGSGRMGTTLVMALIHDTKVAIVHVGDSRLYRLTRKRGLEQITVDHEVGQREIQRGVEPAIAYSRPDAYQLTQALGPRDENFVKPDVQFLDLDEDTLLILCSDGLTDNDLLENHWQGVLDPLLSSRANLEQGVTQLIDLANQYNGHDNITVVLVRAKVRPNFEQQHLP